MAKLPKSDQCFDATPQNDAKCALKVGELSHVHADDKK